MKKNRTLGFIWQIIIALFLLLPLTVSFIYSFAGRWTSILPQNLTFLQIPAHLTTHSAKS